MDLHELFRALSDPGRLRLIERLDAGPATVTELTEVLGFAMPSVLQHLQVLEAGGIVRSEKEGRKRVYRLDPRALDLAEQWIAARRGAWERRWGL